jgi:uncharacterized protein (TIGR02246 family)
MKTSGAWMAAIAAAALLMAGGCASTPTPAETEAFRGEVEKIFARWGDVNLHPDLDGFVALWDENAVKMASGRPVVFGPAAIRVNKQKAFETVIYDKFAIKIEEVQLLGEYGWARGTYVIDSHPKTGGPAVSDPGCYLTVFKRQPDGSWKVYRDTMMAAPK